MGCSSRLGFRSCDIRLEVRGSRRGGRGHRSVIVLRSCVLWSATPGQRSGRVAVCSQEIPPGHVASCSSCGVGVGGVQGRVNAMAAVGVSLSLVTVWRAGVVATVSGVGVVLEQPLQRHGGQIGAGCRVVELRCWG